MERIEKLKEFLKESPDDCFMKHALALEYVKIHNDTEAEKIFTELLDKNPAYIGSYYHLAQLLVRKGQEKEAAFYYEKGMAEARKAGEQRAYNELQAAREEMDFE